MSSLLIWLIFLHVSLKEIYFLYRFFEVLKIEGILLRRLLWTYISFIKDWNFNFCLSIAAEIDFSFCWFCKYSLKRRIVILQKSSAFAKIFECREMLNTYEVKYGVRSPKLFELHVHSCTHLLRSHNTPVPRIWAHIRCRYWSAKIDDISLWLPCWMQRFRKVVYEYSAAISFIQKSCTV